MTIHFIIYKHLYVGELRRYNDRSSEFEESLGNLHVVLYCRADPGESAGEPEETMAYHVGTQNYNSTNLSFPGSARQTGEED